MNRLAIEFEDVRVALDYGIRGDVLLGAALLAACDAAVWRNLDLDHEMIARAQAYVDALPAAEMRLRARLWSAISAHLGSSMHVARSMAVASQALLCAREAEHPRTLGLVLQRYVMAAIRARRYDDGEAALIEAEALDNRSANRRAMLIETRGTLLANKGDRMGALRQWDLLASEYRDLGQDSRVRTATLNLAEGLHATGETRRAIGLLNDMLPAQRSSRDRNKFGVVLLNLANYHAALDEFADAVPLASELVRATVDPIELHLRRPRSLSNSWRSFSHRTVRSSAPRSSRGTSSRRYAAPSTIANTPRRRPRIASPRILRNSMSSAEYDRLIDRGAELSPEAAVRLALGEGET